ncbi:carbamoyltransferase [Dissulfurispira thermophila]|uniref:Carbamoyltransferase n=1 Tax=Dissulfurispira thermophila TaxID=2715679 RepID=A0A7G1H1L4_9BACT|nr:carbamoyltransferase HypF [Dissulfurispira thermophila]BCB96684.1 carbamoyltransferase [Dissulfurispira thermophila]
MNRILISIKGIVQGVGFRPFIYNLAKSLNLKGYVKNTSDGVIIDVEGESLNEFIIFIRDKCPPIGKIESIETEKLPFNGYDDFIIVESIDTGRFTLISPDVSICNDCLKELLDPSDRRYLYPFINCTNCGPRYSITQRVPYDRPNTTMSVFNMCHECLSEYNDPRSRRFHAQPNACHECGPKLEFTPHSSQFTVNKKENPIEAAIELLKHGGIVAIKGLGGFHLCCDAENEDAVKRLRGKKRRSNKPFALMSPDIEAIRQFCEISDIEEKLLTDRRRPIVLLKKRGNGQEAIGRYRIGKRLPEEIAPNNKYLGFMLPYTPLHYLLFYYPPNQFTVHRSLFTAHFDALVMTSGNLSEEPVVISNDEAISKLSDIADAFVMHNRDIFMRVDDSVVKVIGGRHKISFIRRARGYTPEPIKLNDDGPDVLGCGADIKNTFTITRGSYAIVSQHIGDMENLETLKFFEETLDNLKQVYRANPVAIAYDLHPNYLSTQWALLQSQISNFKSQTNHKSQVLNFQYSSPITHHLLPVFYGIQHHYAHIASVMAEKGLKDKVIGVAFDGTGYGTDGNLWGGEFLICDLKGFERVAHFKYIPLPGSDRAIRECWRTAISYISQSVKMSEMSSAIQNPKFKIQNLRFDASLIWDCLDSIGFVDRYSRERIENILKLIDNKQFSPLSSGAGRLFDAVSAITGLCDENTFEGEAAIALENMVHSLRFTVHSEKYPYEILDTNTYSPMIVDFSEMILEIIKDIKLKKDKGLIVIKFHNTLIDVITETVDRISKKYRIRNVALSGGVFQNEYLLDGTISQLLASGFNVHTNEKVPCNDAGISLGQAYIAREMVKAKQLAE